MLQKPEQKELLWEGIWVMGYCFLTGISAYSLLINEPNDNITLGISASGYIYPRLVWSGISRIIVGWIMIFITLLLGTIGSILIYKGLFKEKTIDYEQYLYPTTNKSSEEKGSSSSDSTIKSKN